MIIWLLFMFLPMLVAALGSADLSFSSIVVDSYDAVVTIDENGDMSVVETWNIDYPSADYWVRFRDIGYDKYPDGYPLTMSYANVAAFDGASASVRVLKDGVDITDAVRAGYSWEYDYDEQGYLVDCYPSRSYCESIFTEMDDHAQSLGLVTFVYEYRILGAVTEYSDISELNWRLFEYAEGKIKDVTIEVNLPANAHAKDDILVWGHSPASGTIAVESSSRIAMTLEDVGKDEFVEFRILAPRDLFPNVDAINTVIDPSMNLASLVDYEEQLAAETNLRITVAQIVLYAAIASAAAMGLLTLYVYRRYDKEYVPKFQHELYREVLERGPRVRDIERDANEEASAERVYE